MALEANKTYRFTLAPQYHYARLYIFTACGAAQINADCGSNGATGAVSDNINGGTSGSVIFTPATKGTYTVAVDSSSTTYAGTFQLDIEPYTPPANATCAKAQVLNLGTAGSVTLSGSTDSVANEFGTAINCGQAYYTYAGGQLYYKVRMTAGKTYRVTLSPQFTAAMYLFGTTCTAPAINADCGSGGLTGDLLSYVSSGYSGFIDFKPTVTGDYTIAVDSRQSSSYYSGAFTLTVEDYQAPDNTTCAKAKTIALTAGGSVTVSGTTAGVSNEYTNVRCGSSYQMNGGQVYYRIYLTAGKTYKVSLSPQFYAYLYLFGTTCGAGAIDADCASGGVSGDFSGAIYSGNTGAIVFKPTTSGNYTIAVDSTSTSSYYQGAFSLTVEEHTPPANSTCATARAVTLPASGAATVTGDTTGLANEFGSQINCGYSSYYNFVAPQLYYEVTLDAAKSYKFTLTPSYYSVLYVFSDTCSPAQIDADCRSNGTSGGYVMSYAGQSRSLIFSPPTSGTYKFAVDSYNSSYTGAFTVTIAPFAVASNRTCSSAQAVVLPASGAATITGDTTGATNEFGTAINCGSLYNIFRGDQLYYKVRLGAQATTFQLTPTYYYAYLYVFRDSAACDWAKINADCGSAGSYGDVSGYATPATPGTLSFTPAAAGDYIVAVDSTSSRDFGTFTLEISQ